MIVFKKCYVFHDQVLAFLERTCLYRFKSTVLLVNEKCRFAQHVFCQTVPDTLQDIAWLSVSSLARLF